MTMLRDNPAIRLGEEPEFRNEPLNFFPMTHWKQLRGWKRNLMEAGNFHRHCVSIYFLQVILAICIVAYTDQL